MEKKLNLNELINKEPFRVFEYEGKIQEFYTFNDLGIDSKIEGLPFRFLLDKDKTKIKLVVDKDYYDSVPEFFSDEVLPHAFELWISASKVETFRKRFSWIMRIVLPLCVLFFFYPQYIAVQVVSWSCTVFLLIYWIFFIVNIKKYRKKQSIFQEKLGIENSEKIQQKIKEYYQE